MIASVDGSLLIFAVDVLAAFCLKTLVAFQLFSWICFGSANVKSHSKEVDNYVRVLFLSCKKSERRDLA